MQLILTEEILFHKWIDTAQAELVALAATSDHSPGSSLNNHQNWQEKCKTMINDLLLSLGPESQWFDRPPDKRYIPDYYEKIKKPMDLGTMVQKLDTGRYKEPQNFCNVSADTSTISANMSSPREAARVSSDLIRHS